MILGECAFAPSSRMPQIQYLHEGGPAPSTYVMSVGSLGSRLTLESSPFRGALVMYRRSALGSVRFHAPVATTIPTTTTTTTHAAATPHYGHLGFETVGLDDKALTQVRFFSGHVGALYMLNPLVIVID